MRVPESVDFRFQRAFFCFERYAHHTKMSAEIGSIAAAVSELACKVFRSQTRAVRVLDDELPAIEVTAMNSLSTGGSSSAASTNDTTEPIIGIESFWPEDCSLSQERKKLLYWQYQRSMGCQEYAAALAIVLKGLADGGIKLMHEGKPVIDILLLNTIEFDVSDILSARGSEACLRMRDPVTDLTLPVIATHETMDRITAMGESVCARLGMRMPPREGHNRERLKRHRPESYTGTVPHWWVAAVVEDARTSRHVMVHLDICGAAYDPSALVATSSLTDIHGPPSSFDRIPLKMFVTPEYALIPNGDGSLRHKLTMKAFLSERAETIPGQTTRVVLQPKSNRYFRCYHRDDTSMIEATPLATFVERNHLSNDGEIEDMVATIRRVILCSALRSGIQVTVCNLQSKPELNGRRGVIQEKLAKDKIASDRVPVLIQGLAKSLQLKTTCIRLVPWGGKHYISLEERLREHQAKMDAMKDEVPSSDEMSKKQKSQIRNALDANDPAVAKVLASIHSGQMTFTSFADQEFKRGLEMFLRPPLDAVLPVPLRKTLQSGFELSNHPKAGDAIKLINLLKAAKQRLLQEDPDAVNADGSINAIEGSDFLRMHSSVVQKIRGDEGLYFVFEQLEQLGLYVNPAK